MNEAHRTGKVGAQADQPAYNITRGAELMVPVVTDDRAAQGSRTGKPEFLQRPRQVAVLMAGVTELHQRKALQSIKALLLLPA